MCNKNSEIVNEEHFFIYMTLSNVNDGKRAPISKRSTHGNRKHRIFYGYIVPMRWW